MKLCLHPGCPGLVDCLVHPLFQRDSDDIMWCCQDGCFKHEPVHVVEAMHPKMSVGILVNWCDEHYDSSLTPAEVFSYWMGYGNREYRR